MGDSEGRLERRRAMPDAAQRYLTFMRESTEGIWRLELDEPMDVTMPVAEQREWAFRTAHLVECNDAMAAMYGYERAEELHGARLGDLLPRTPDNEAYLDAFLTSGYRLRGAESAEVDRNGEMRYFTNNLVGIVENGRLVGAWGTQADITLRKQAVDALRASEARLIATMDTAVDFAIITMNADGEVEGWSSGAERTFGHAAGDMMGERLDTLFTPEDRAAGVPRTELGNAAQHGRAEDERWHLRRDGSRIYMSGVVRPIYYDGALAGYVKVARDVTQQKRAENALRESEARYRELAEDLAATREALLAADRNKDEFLATLAHELRNPLAPVRSAAHMIALTNPQDPRVQWSLDVITRQTRAMTRLIDDLMDVSRITQNKLQLHADRVTIAAILRDAIDASRPHMEAQGHRLVVDVPEREMAVFGDQTRLAQVFSNLLENAAKYTERGGTITVTASPGRDHVAVAVRDTGIGIAPGDVDHIFDLFSQVHTSLKRSRGGLGIGLSLARQLIHLHGGSISVRSDGPGMGSEFIVRLPPAGDDVSAAPAPATAGLAAVAGLRILVADDHVDGANALRALLEQNGALAYSVYDGLAAIAAADEVMPDVLLLDIGMPGMSGHDVARRLRATDAGARAIMIAISGWGNPDDRQRSAEAGFDLHLVKPVDPAALLAVIAEMARSRLPD